MDGRKRYKNASVDEKLFIRFQETENGGFRKRISVDRASDQTWILRRPPSRRLIKPQVALEAPFFRDTASILLLETFEFSLEVPLSIYRFEKMCFPSKDAKLAS